MAQFEFSEGARLTPYHELGDGALATSGMLSRAAFLNPGGTVVVVLSNRGPDIHTQLVLGTDALEINLEADSVHTIRWS